MPRGKPGPSDRHRVVVCHLVMSSWPTAVSISQTRICFRAELASSRAISLRVPPVAIVQSLDAFLSATQA